MLITAAKAVSAAAPKQHMIRVLIADDQTLIREGLRTLLGMDSGIEVVGEAADGTEAIAEVESTSVDVLLFDVRIPG